jgi:hypothetical protein
MSLAISLALNMIVQTSKQHCGKGFLNKVINNLPFELHLPGYRYCGPGTKLEKRLARGDPGINPLDSACKQHDIAYSQDRDNIAARNIADNILADKASKRIFAKDASVGERAAAILVSNVMKMKSKFGMGLRKSKKSPLRKRKSSKKKPQKIKKISFKKIIQAAKKAMINSQGSQMAVKSALEGARAAVKSLGGKKHTAIPRILPLPSKKHVGGALPLLIPVLSAASALGGLIGRASAIIKAISNVRTAKKQLEENSRHNKAMESIAIGKGLHIKPYKNGMGLFLSPKNLH